MLGTQAANTRMIIEENAVKRLAQKLDGKATVTVRIKAYHAPLADSKEKSGIKPNWPWYANWLANKIDYNVEVKFMDSKDSKGSGPTIKLPTFTFSPFITVDPTRAENFLEVGLALEFVDKCREFHNDGFIKDFEETCQS